VLDLIDYLNRNEQIKMTIHTIVQMFVVSKFFIFEEDQNEDFNVR